MMRMTIRRMRKMIKARGDDDAKDSYDRSDKNLEQGQ